MLPKLFGESHIMAMPSTRSAAQKHRVMAEFLPLQPLNQALKEISLISNPQVVTWYIGPNGLKKNGVIFLRENMLDPLLSYGETYLWLVDLTAWTAFKGHVNGLTKQNSCNPLITSRLASRGSIIPASTILALINSEEKTPVCNLIQDILLRKCLTKKSLSYPDSGILIKNLFPNGLLPASSIAEMDASKAYSIIQYIELFYIINYIINHTSSTAINDEFNIIFLLPNDETEYYKHHETALSDDLNTMINATFPQVGDKYVNIKFIPYIYGDQISDRPYNAPGERIRKAHFKPEMITNYSPNRVWVG